MMILLQSIKLQLQHQCISSTKAKYIKVVRAENLPLIIRPTQDRQFLMEILRIPQLQLRRQSIITGMLMIELQTIFRRQCIGI